MYKLGRTSQNRLNTCHPDLVLIITEAIKVSQIDFGVSQGERTVEQQQMYFNAGKSKVNPKDYDTLDELLKRGKHIVDGDIRKLSEAVDLFAYYNGAAHWDTPSLAFIGGVVISTSNRLFSEGKIKHKIRWGGNWNSDSVIITDQSFQDLPHYELVKK